MHRIRLISLAVAFAFAGVLGAASHGIAQDNAGKFRVAEQKKQSGAKRVGSSPSGAKAPRTASPRVVSPRGNVNSPSGVSRRSGGRGICRDHREMSERQAVLSARGLLRQAVCRPSSHVRAAAPGSVLWALAAPAGWHSAAATTRSGAAALIGTATATAGAPLWH